MTARNGSIPILRVIWALARNQPVRYPISLAAWTVIWTMPVLIGFISAAYFDSLTGQAVGWNLATVIAALWAWSFARIGAVFLAMRLHSNVLFRANAGMKRNMLSWIYSLPGAQPLAETPGEVVSRFRDDVEHTVEAFDFTVDLIGSGVSAIVSFIVLFVIDPAITLIVFTPVALIILVTSRLGTRIRRYRSAARDATESITGFLGETLGSVQSVKVAGAERTMLARFELLNEDRRRMMVRDRTFTAGLEAVFFNTVSIGTGLILILAAGSLSSTGNAGLTIGQFALFVYLLQMVTDSAWFIGVFLARLKQAGVSIERIVALMEGSTWPDVVRRLDLDEAVPQRAPAEHPTVPGASLLSVRGLTYHYPTSGKGIDAIDLDIAPGELVVVTGRIGAGKTTLLRTILGLVPAQGGEIRWRGSVVDDPAGTMVPPRAAYTPQVPRLFSMTLGENLLLGHDAGDGELRAAVAAATLEHDLEQMGDGFDTMIGPRGVRLSGGQIQRSAAARMLVRSPELLVFDDLSSALDVETEATLWERLFTDYTGTSALVVSHRRPALLRADQVIVLEDGRIADRGTAQDLLQRSAAFRDLWG
jgi:ATP-binding cassette, subfamily B, bacterial